MLPIVILAGGLATRLRPISHTIPKSLVPVHDEPFIFHQLRMLQRQGVTDVYLLIGHMGEQIVAAVGDGHEFGLHIRYVDEGPHLLGTAGALIHAYDQLPQAFMMMYGDSYLTCDFKAVETAFLKQQRGGLMTVYENQNQWDRSNVVFEAGEILKYDKQQRTAEMHHIDYGLSCFKRDVFAGYQRGEVLDLTVVYQELLAKHQLAGYEVRERFYEVGSFSGLEDFVEFIV